MKKTLIASMALFMLAVAPAARAQTDTAHLGASAIGMPIYTSDGIKIGEVTELGTYRGENSMMGEVSKLMGLGTRSVVIPETAATVQNDRVVLTIPSERMNELLVPGQ